MAKSKVEVQGEWKRPSFNFSTSLNDSAITTRLLESIRNVLEGIADTQMLQCEIAGCIRGTMAAVETLVRLAQAKRRKGRPTKRR